MRTLYAITHINRRGMRTLTRANQARNHFTTPEEAKRHLDNVMQGTGNDVISKVYGAQAVGTFEVRPVQCHESGDAISIWFNE